jgi:hypothetical protein
MNEKVSAPDLRRIFLDAFKHDNYSVQSTGNPFLFEVFGIKSYVFLKNISPAYYPKYPDIYRIQLPFSEHFNTISASAFPFVILGYNKTYDTFTAWSPFEIKERLNQKSNVSLFTRDSFQEKIRLNIFKERFISNGDKVILFDSRSLPMFFNNFTTLFSVKIENRKFKYIKSKSASQSNEVKYGELSKIDNQSILKDLMPYEQNSDIIGAVLMCCENYSQSYPDMSMNQWRKLVTNYFQQKDIYLIK